MDVASLVFIVASAAYLLIVLKRYGGLGLLELVTDAFSGWVAIPIGFIVGIVAVAGEASWAIGYLVGAWLLVTAGRFHLISRKLEDEARQKRARKRGDRQRELDALRGELQPEQPEEEEEGEEMSREVKCPHCGAREHWRVDDIALQGRAHGTGPWYMSPEAHCCKQCMHVSLFSNEDRAWWGATERENES